jgi:hypothetical protein
MVGCITKVSLLFFQNRIYFHHQDVHHPCTFGNAYTLQGFQHCHETRQVVRKLEYRFSFSAAHQSPSANLSIKPISLDPSTVKSFL